MPAQVIDQSIPTAGLLAQVMIANYADHQSLYWQAQIFARSGVAIPRSILAEWIDICGVRLQPLTDALREPLLTATMLHANEKHMKKPTPRECLQGTSPPARLSSVCAEFLP